MSSAAFAVAILLAATVVHAEDYPTRILEITGRRIDFNVSVDVANVISDVQKSSISSNAFYVHFNSSETLNADALMLPEPGKPALFGADQNVHITDGQPFGGRIDIQPEPKSPPYLPPVAVQIFFAVIPRKRALVVLDHDQHSPLKCDFHDGCAADPSSVVCVVCAKDRSPPMTLTSRLRHA